MLDILGLDVDIADDAGTLKVSTMENYMNDNEFEIDGATFMEVLIGVKDMRFGCCNGCYFNFTHDVNGGCSAGVNVPPCTAGTRDDGKFVIFVENNK